MTRLASLLVSVFCSSALAKDYEKSFEPYGFIKLDSAYDTRASSNGDYMKWVNSAPNTDPQFNMTGNQTRLGLKIKALETDAIEVNGQIEADLYSLQGGDAQEFKPGTQFRHFYFKAKFANSGLTLLAGQTSDVVAPLVPDTINYTVLWWAGNLGYRRPQLRLMEDIRLAEQTALKVEVAAVRVLGHDSEASYTNPGTPANPSGTANDARMPGVQARVSFSTSVLTHKPTEFGLSSYYGAETYKTNKDLRQSLYSVDLIFPILESLTLKAEGYTGQNTDTLNGGIGQGIYTTDFEIRSVGAIGGWLQLAYKLNDKWNFNFGLSHDQAHAGDLPSLTGRLSNESYYGNAFYHVTSALQTCFEISNWDTAYKDSTNNQSTRYQLAFIYDL